MEFTLDQIRNIRETPEVGFYMLEVDHPTLGWIEYGISANIVDPVEYGRLLAEFVISKLQAGEVSATAYVNPAPLTIQEKIEAAGIPEGELVEYLVDQIQARLEN